MSVLNLAVLLGGKYLLRKVLERASQVVNELGSSFCSQSLALSLSEKGKNHRRMASADTPLSLIVSHFARNLLRRALGLLEGYLSNCSRFTKPMSVGLSSKLLASIARLTMDEVTPDDYGRA